VLRRPIETTRQTRTWRRFPFVAEWKHGIYLADNGVILCFYLSMVASMSKLILSFIVFSTSLLGGTKSRTPGNFSRLAISVPEIAADPHGLSSPDGLSVLHAEENDKIDCCWPYRVWLTRNGKNYALRFGTYVESEVAWSPDSRAFFVTYSDGGAIGTFHVLVYRVDNNGVHKSEPISNREKSFRPDCITGDYPNIGAIQWGEDSSTLIIAVEVPPHSGCVDMGTFKAFEISLADGKHLKEYDQLEAKRVFAKTLGVELQNADDGSSSKPKSCFAGICVDAS
jgi:hypothetical protein